MRELVRGGLISGGACKRGGLISGSLWQVTRQLQTNFVPYMENEKVE